MQKPHREPEHTNIIRPCHGRCRPNWEGKEHAGSVWLLPLSWIYQLSLQATRKHLSGGKRESECRVISVGNIEVGGTGKTPFCIYLLERMQEAGLKPVYISRGYRSRSEKLNAVTVVLPEKINASLPLPSGVRILSRDQRLMHLEIGDEGAMVAGRLPNVPLLFSRRKEKALGAANLLFSPSHAVIDDGFQSWRLARDTDVVLLDADHPFGSGKLIPAGSLREDVGALKRADYIGFVGSSNEDVLGKWSERIHSMTRRDIPLFTVRRRLVLLSPSGMGIKNLEGSAASLSGIARPDAFDSLLREAGFDLVASIRYPDHHFYSTEDINFVKNKLAKDRADILVTTEKDWVKLRQFGFEGISLILARMEIDPEGFRVASIT